MDVINDLVLQTVASPWLFAILFALTVLDGFFPPVPSETVLVAAAAVMASSGNTGDIVALGITAAIAATIGDNIAFLIGRTVGTTRWAWMRRPRVVAAFAHAENALERRSAALILGARYIPVGRVAVNMSAGALGFPWSRFLPLSAVAGVGWSALSLAIGLLTGSWASEHPVIGAVIGVVVALALGLVIDRIAARRRRRLPLAHLAG